MSNAITKYDSLISTLKTDVISEVNNTLSLKFNPIIQEINKDISIFNLLEKLDNLIHELPTFKNLQFKYNNLLIEHKKLLSLYNTNLDNSKDITLIINDLNNNNSCTLPETENLNVKLSKDNEQYRESSESNIFSGLSDYEHDTNSDDTNNVEDKSSESESESENSYVDLLDEKDNKTTGEKSEKEEPEEEEPEEEESEEEEYENSEEQYVREEMEEARVRMADEEDDHEEKGKKEVNQKKFVIYTDGACKGNPGYGGWGVLIIDDKQEKRLFGGVKDTTNNKMELLATIKALEYFKNPEYIEINTDSRYVKDGITNWIISWKKNQWKTSQKKDVKNIDLWQKLDKLCNIHTIQWNWVKGHSNNIKNNIADFLANEGIKQLEQENEKAQQAEAEEEGDEEEGDEEEGDEEEGEEEEEEDKADEPEDSDEEEGEEEEEKDKADEPEDSDEEEEGEEEEEEEEEGEEDEEFELIEIQGKEYFTNNEKGGEIYTCVDDDIGEKVGYFDKKGIAHFNKK